MVKDVSLLKSNLFGHRRWHILCTVNLYRLCVLLSGFLPPASPFYIMSFEIVSPSCKLYFTAQYERERKKGRVQSDVFILLSLHRLDGDLFFFFFFFLFCLLPLRFWEHSTWAYQEGSSWPQLPSYCSVPCRTVPFRESFRAIALLDPSP